MKDEVLKVSQSSIAQALSADYFCIYYINVENDRFIEYSSSPMYRSLGLPSEGDDFIGFARKRFETIIHQDDQERFLESFDKEKIIKALDTNGTFGITFRMMFRNEPVYVYMKITRMIEQEARHAVIGISSVDELMRASQAYEEAHSASVTYQKVAQALAGDYFSIYVVDPETDRFVEYSADKDYYKLGVEKSGDDFFGTSRRNMSRLLYEEDRDRFLSIFTKEKIMTILERDGHFTMKYRLMLDGIPIFVSMKAILQDDRHGKQLIIGTNDIDAQMKREAEYQRSMADARTSARNDFLANMSHDIRTPMNAIVGYTNIAKSNVGDPEKVNDALDKIGSSSHFLLSLINDILDISKIESGKMQLFCAPCDLEDIFHRIEDITALQAKNKSLNITYDHSKVRHYKVLSDELRIEQILINIISNAIKYTPEGGTVDLIAREESSPEGSNKYTFIVRDNGIGISEDYLPYIFESFTREEKTTVNRVRGTGLGLAITARVVELMGGTISVKSAVGHGSEFTVELKLESLGEAGERETEKSCEDTDLRGRRVLLVEDNPINMEIAVMILEQFGLEVECAKDGKVGFERVRDNGDGYYDAVLMDIQMPVMNGHESASAIRSLGGEYHKHLPIIAVSANAYDEDVRDCLNAGMNAHIAKPYAPEKIHKLLKEWIR